MLVGGGDITSITGSSGVVAHLDAGPYLTCITGSTLEMPTPEMFSLYLLPQ